MKTNRWETANAQIMYITILLKEKNKEKMYRTLFEVKIVTNFLKPINDIKPQVKKYMNFKHNQKRYLKCLL